MNDSEHIRVQGSAVHIYIDLIASTTLRRYQFLVCIRIQCGAEIKRCNFQSPNESSIIVPHGVSLFSVPYLQFIFNYYYK